MENRKLIIIESCTECGKVLKEEWRFCPYCKTPVDGVTCPYCREELKKTWLYCPFCKNRVKEAGLGRDDSNEWLSTILKK